MALSSVGTHGMIVGLVRSMRFSASSSEKRGMMMISAPLAMPTFMTTVSANTWKNGSTPNTRSRAMLHIGAPRRDLLRVHVAVGVREHGALGRARGAARVLQHGDVGQRVDGDLLGTPVAGHHLGFEHDLLARRRGRGRASSFDLNSRNSAALATGSSAGNEQTTARFKQPVSSSASTLPNSDLQVERHHQFGVAVLHLLGELGRRYRGG